MKLFVIVIVFTISFFTVSAFDRDSYEENIGFAFEQGNSNSIEYKKEVPSYVDLFIDEVTYDTSSFDLSFRLGNKGDKVSYFPILKLYYSNYSTVFEIPYLEVGSSLNKSFLIENISDLVAISLIPNAIGEEIFFDNNVFYFTPSETKPSSTPWILEVVSTEEDSLWINKSLNSTLDFFWGNDSLFTYGEDFVYLDFSKKNDLVGNYTISLKADDYADFYIDDILVLQTFDREKSYIIENYELYGNETFFLYYGEDEGSAFLNLSFSKSN